MKEAIESKDLSSYEDEYKKDKSHKVIERTVRQRDLRFLDRYLQH